MAFLRIACVAFWAAAHCMAADSQPRFLAHYSRQLSDLPPFKALGESCGACFSETGFCGECQEDLECQCVEACADPQIADAPRTCASKCSTAVCPQDMCDDGAPRRHIGDDCCACPDACSSAICAQDMCDDGMARRQIGQNCCACPLKQLGESCGSCFSESGSCGECQENLECQCVGACADQQIVDAPRTCVSKPATTTTTTTTVLKALGQACGPCFSPSGFCGTCEEDLECQCVGACNDTQIADAPRTCVSKCATAVCPKDICPDGSARRPIGDDCCACPEELEVPFTPDSGTEPATTTTTTTTVLKALGQACGPCFSPSGFCGTCEEDLECQCVGACADPQIADAPRTCASKCATAVCQQDICPDGNARRPIGDDCCACPEEPCDIWCRFRHWINELMGLSSTSQR